MQNIKDRKFADSILDEAKVIYQKTLAKEQEVINYIDSKI